MHCDGEPERAAGRRAAAAQFLRFGAVGVVGFLIDTAVVYALRRPVGIYGAGAAGYLVAATANWWINRLWTFRGQSDGPLLRQWAYYLLANLAGLALNRGTFYALISISPVCMSKPVIAIAAGAVAGMFANFGLSRAVFGIRLRSPPG